jgi:single-strand DNA-binding protein
MKRVDKESKSRSRAKNEVHLIGRVSSIIGERRLPSGDEVSEFRIVIDNGSKRAPIDTIDIAVWKSVLRRRIKSMEMNEWVDIKGSVRRRFWQGATGIASRWQVEAHEIKRI